MSSVTFDDFSIGKDLRKGASVSDANRLRELKNAYVTTGRVIRKRPGVVKVVDLEAGTKGLIPGLGKLNTFYEDGSITHVHPLFQANLVDHGSTTSPVEKVHYGDVFNGFLYVVVQHQNGDVKHHYFDQSPTLITDVNAPKSTAVVKAQQKIWAVDGDKVRFTATGDPRDWTTADDAGFLPTGLHQRGGENALALGIFKETGLVVFHVDGSQLWGVDPDPALHNLIQMLAGTQTRYPESVFPLFDDLYFLSDSGIRSISESAIKADSGGEIDVGSPVDAVVRPLLPPATEPKAAFYSKGGQYWLSLEDRVFVFTFSKSAKVTAWSEYFFPWAIDDLAELNGEMYLRSGDTVYMVDENATNDDGQIIDVEAEMPFVDAKKPGHDKMWWGMDAVLQGTADISFKYSPNNPSFETQAIEVSGDNRTGGIIGVEVTSAHIAPVIKHSRDEEFQLDAITLYFEDLGPR